MYIYICDYIEFIIYIDRYIHYKNIYISCSIVLPPATWVKLMLT